MDQKEKMIKIELLFCPGIQCNTMKKRSKRAAGNLMATLKKYLSCPRKTKG
jgi:hypothetical protein